MKRPGHTRPFRGPHGEIVAGSIAASAYLRLGGVDQWVLMRGESSANPPLIVLHGGPGMSDTAFMRCYNAVLEKHFTVVYWDQRGAGKSYDPAIPRSTMNVEQFLADLDELVEVVCKRLGKTKVVLFGHSWGSALGVLYAARFPAKVALYIGAAQIGDWAAGESASYAFALAQAKRLGHRKAEAALLAIGPPPHTADQMFSERTWVLRLTHTLGSNIWMTLRSVLSTPEISIVEALRGMPGFRFSLDAMWPEVSQLNLIERVPALQMPVFCFVGRQDHWVPPETSVAYFDALAAPSKQLVWFEHSGHEMFVDEAAKFNAAMLEQVRPLLTPDLTVAVPPSVARPAGRDLLGPR